MSYLHAALSELYGDADGVIIMVNPTKARNRVLTRKMAEIFMQEWTFSHAKDIIEEIPEGAFHSEISCLLKLRFKGWRSCSSQTFVTWSAPG